MRKRFSHSNHVPFEFELDLAPLLAVMVKLVPVLLVSSAFVQVMMLETDLPQAVKEAVQTQDQKPMAAIQIKADTRTGFQVVVNNQGQQTVESVPLSGDQFDFASLHKTLQKVKTLHPQVFKIELAPEADVSYRDVIRITDEARRSRDKTLKFPFQDKENKTVTTDFMFPDVVFTNVFDG